MIDAHQHFWRISRGDYGWMTDAHEPIRRDRLPEDLAPMAARFGIEGTVVVQAAPTTGETRFLLDLADRTPLIRGVVGWVDLAAPDAPEQVARIAREPALKGLRPMLQDIEETEWVLRPEVIAGLRAMARAGLVFDALITPRHLSVIDRLAALLPELRIVVDHCAKPVFGPDGDPGAAWLDGMERLAAHERTSCKISGLANEFGPSWSAQALRSVVDHVLACFGPDRLMWGSDWPVLDLAGAYDGWLSAARTLTDHLPEAAQARIFGGTATAVYGLAADRP